MKLSRKRTLTVMMICGILASAVWMNVKFELLDREMKECDNTLNKMKTAALKKKISRQRLFEDEVTYEWTGNSF